MRLSVIIVNYHAEPKLAACLRSLCLPAMSPEIEILVVDNGSTERGRAELNNGFPAVKWLSAGSNLGFGRACNWAAKESTGSHLLFLNPDTVMLPEGMASILSSLDSFPLSGSIAGMRILNPDGSREFSARAFPDWRAAFANRYSLLTRLYPGNRWSRAYLKSVRDMDSACEVDWVSGAAMLIPSALFQRLDGFDERFFMYMEDVDLCKRARQAGVSVWYWPEASVTHEIAASSRRIPGRALRYRHISIWRYYQKHMRTPLADPLVAAFLFMRCASLRIAGWLSRLASAHRSPRQAWAQPPTGIDKDWTDLKPEQ